MQQREENIVLVDSLNGVLGSGVCNGPQHISWEVCFDKLTENITSKRIYSRLVNVIQSLICIMNIAEAGVIYIHIYLSAEHHIFEYVNYSGKPKPVT